MFDLIRRGLGAAPSSIDGNYVIVTTEEVLDSAPRHRGTTPKGSPGGSDGPSDPSLSVVGPSPTARPRALGALRAPLVARLAPRDPPGGVDPAGEYPQLTPPP